jgi:short-subunit dehydrogenase
MSIILTLFFIFTLGPGLKILCMNCVRTVGSVHVVIVPSIIGFQTGEYFSVYVATVLFLVLQADAIDKQQMVSQF